MDKLHMISVGWTYHESERNFQKGGPANSIRSTEAIT
jgi:hypothetical protein